MLIILPELLTMVIVCSKGIFLDFVFAAEGMMGDVTRR